MKLFELFAELSLDAGNFNRGVNAAGKQGKNLASMLSGGFSAVSAKTIAMGHALYDFSKQVARTTVSFAKSVVTEYAQAEQLIGGIETLFKGNADMVIRNSQLAFRTAGMSANEYMETVTGFSASLLQGLGGDTAEAARVADMAVQDMSDNANKMGTDMALILNAYQGFAKDNFTMLDNLKLGYGGTAEEMARLINDSGVMGDTIVTAATVSQVPLHKMYEAIHVVQTELDITGTTAKEAASTISGSFKSFQAAWRNLLAGFGTDQEMAELMDNLFTTGEALITNVLNILPKMGERALQGLDSFLQRFDLYRSLRHAYDQGGWEAVVDAGIAIFKREFTDFWDNKLPGIIKDGANFAISVINSIFGTNIPAIESINLPTWDEISTAVSEWWSGIRSSLEGAASWTLKLFENPTEAADDIKNAISTWWTGTAKPAIEAGCTWVLQMFDNPTEDQEAVKAKIAEWWSIAGAAAGSAASFVASLVGVEDTTADGIKATVESWWQTIGAGLGNVCKIFASFGTPDETDTAQAVKDLMKWFTDDFLGQIGDTLVITGKIIFDLADDALVPVMEKIQTLVKDALSAIGLGWLFEEDSEQIAFKADMQAQQAAEAVQTSGAFLAGEYAGLDENLTDTMWAYGYQYLTTGKSPTWIPTEEDFDVTNQELMDQWHAFQQDMYTYVDQLDLDSFEDWFDEDAEGKSDEEGIAALAATVASIVDAIAALPSAAASAAASALNGAKVELDGSTAGSLLVPYVTPGVSAEIARNNRVIAKAIG